MATPALQQLKVLRVEAKANPANTLSTLHTQGSLDHVAEETPIAFEYNGVSHVVMLASPCDLEDLAYGFSLSEGIVERARDIHDLHIHMHHAPDAAGISGISGITLQIDIASAAFMRLKAHRRSLAGRTGCGLCGAESLAQVLRDIPVLPPVRSSQAASQASASHTSAYTSTHSAASQPHAPFPMTALWAGMRQLPTEQHLQQQSGATHAACCVNRLGAISHVREDVGRHNALDKTLGALARAAMRAQSEPQQQHPPQHALIITSRASFEMVQKAASQGHTILAAVSAPTAAAVRLAQRLNLSLIGFLREQHATIYTHAERLDLQA